MAELFDVVGEGFFKPLSSQFKKIYVDCLTIIYDSYRTELSYGADRDIMVAKLTDYFESLGVAEIQFEEDQETLKDSRAKATTFLRKLKEYGWVQSIMSIQHKPSMISIRFILIISIRYLLM